MDQPSWTLRIADMFSWNLLLGHEFLLTTKGRSDQGPIEMLVIFWSSVAIKDSLINGVDIRWSTSCDLTQHQDHQGIRRETIATITLAWSQKLKFSRNRYISWVSALSGGVWAISSQGKSKRKTARRWVLRLSWTGLPPNPQNHPISCYGQWLLMISSHLKY